MTPESSADPSDPAVPPDRPAAQLPEWYPAWARDLADLYFSGSSCLFLLHGNVHDLIRYGSDDAPGYCNLSEFLATQLFGRWDVVVSHDLSRGLRPQAGSDAQRLRGMVQYLTSIWGDPGAWPREPDKILALLDAFIERVLVEEPASRKSPSQNRRGQDLRSSGTESPMAFGTGSKSVAVVFEYAQYLVSAGDLDALARGQAARLVRLLNWAQNPHIKRVNMAFCLVADRLAEVNDRLAQSSHVVTVEIPLPDRDERCRFIDWLTRGRSLSDLADFTRDELAAMSNGLSLVNLQVLLSQAMHAGRRLDAARFRELKKTLIERQCRGLVEFVEPQHTLELVVGYDEAKRRLREDAQRIARGQLDAAPMGYLVCGPVGTGKTFLAECYAGTIGIPCVVLKNFRSKYVGETEGNLQQVLTVLRSLGPVVVIVDEADAALGSRQAEGDSGTSARVFSMIAAQMGNTRYRGSILWMLLTSRPDLLPIDLKRQGRAEVHIPLLYPRRDEDIRAMFQAMAKKNKVPLDADAIPTVTAERHLTGADIESVVLMARRAALGADRNQVTRADLDGALQEFIPSAQGLEKELQELAAVLECTQRSFLPPDWQQKLAESGATSRLQERLVALRQLIES